MAVAATHLTTGANATNGASYDTASVTPSADVLVLVWVSGTGTNSATAPTVTGNGLTYVLADEAHSDGNVISEYLYRAMGSPSAGALNISWTAGNVTGCNWSVAEFSGVDTAGTNGSGAVAETAVANANATSVTVTLVDVAAGNATAGGFATASALPVTPGAGYTELGEAAHNNPATVIQSEWREDGSTIVDASWLTAQNSVGIGVEIVPASGGGGAVDLVVDDATHGHAADSPALTQAHALAVEDAAHAHAADNVTLTTTATLVADDSTLSHAAESPALTQTHVLGADDATHAHAADSPTLTSGSTLAVDSAHHGHVADAPALTQVHVLEVADATHAHAAESPGLTQLHQLAAHDALHAHLADVATLTVGLIVAPPSRTLTVPAQDRATVVAAAPRVVAVPPRQPPEESP